MNIRFVIGLLLLAKSLLGQSSILEAQSHRGKLGIGRADTLLISLRDGDYAHGTILQSGKTRVTILNPDRSARAAVDAFPRDTTSIVFAAEGQGAYGIEIMNRDTAPVAYELRFDEVLSLDERLKPESFRDTLESPRINALKKQLAMGDSNTTAFWSEINREGTPLVEQYTADPRYQLVTFLWRAQFDTRNVLVTGSFLDPVSPSDLAMHRLGMTDVWYLTARLPVGARFTYTLSPNDPMTPKGVRSQQRRATMQMDPLNPHRANCPPGTSKFDCISVGELPNAPPQPWSARRPNTPSGKLERATLHSAAEHVERGFAVYTSAAYQTNGPPSALVVLFDGADYLSPGADDRTQHDTPAIIENLIADSLLPSTVVVFLDNLPGRRLPDLLGNPKLADFLAMQLVPWVRTHYNVSHDPRKTVIGGFSVGGFAATYVGLRHSEAFGNVLSQSGAFWWSPEHNGGVCSSLCDSDYVASRLLDATTEPNWLAGQFSIVPRLPLRFYLYAGTFEVSWGKGGNILEATRHLRDVLRARGYEVHYQQYAAGHDGLTWQGTIADGLVALIGNSRGAVSTPQSKH